jgi:hypothetical protein
MIGSIIKGISSLGTFGLAELLVSASTRKIDGIAISKEDDREVFLAFLKGNPEGAIFIDEKGALYGDKAVMLLKGSEKYELFEVKPDIIEAIAMGCKIQEKSHIQRGIASLVPEIGPNRSGVGVLTLVILQDKIPRNGIRVTIRKEGIIVGSDITTNDGSVAFRLSYSDYECVIIDKNHQIRTFRLQFDATHPKMAVEI